MSVMIIDDSSINRAFNTIDNLMKDAPNKWAGAYHDIEELHKFNEVGFDFRWSAKYQYRGLEYLARWSAIFNLRNFTRRYSHHGEFYRVSYKVYRDKFKTVTRDELAQSITTLTCLKYNISDHYDECPQFKALAWLIDQLKTIFIETSPEMLGTKWG